MLLVVFLMVSLLYPNLAYEATLSANWSAIELIASLLIVARFFEISGALERLALKILEVAGGLARASIFSLIILTWFTAAFIMNDTSIFIFTSLAIVLPRALKTSKSRMVAYTAIAANRPLICTHRQSSEHSYLNTLRYGVSRFRLRNTPSSQQLAYCSYLVSRIRN